MMMMMVIMTMMLMWLLMLLLLPQDIGVPLELWVGSSRPASRDVWNGTVRATCQSGACVSLRLLLSVLLAAAGCQLLLDWMGSIRRRACSCLFARSFVRSFVRAARSGLAVVVGWFLGCCGRLYVRSLICSFFLSFVRSF
jgi:hypothetical protein